VASYPGSYGTVAGGLERLGRHPIDAGWQESIEELRIGPDVPPAEYVNRELISSVSPNCFRRGTVDSHPLYAIPDTDGQWLLYLTDSRMKMFGIIRDLENYRPEICAIVETDLPWDIIEENHPATIEYDHLEFVEFSADGIADFIEETSDISPALLGTMVVVGEAVFGGFIGRFSDHYTDPERISSTVFEGFETTMCTREDSR